MAVSDIGGSGLVIIYAPVPAADATELPTKFVARTLAQTQSPDVKPYGAACRTDIVTVQMVDETLQQTASVANVPATLRLIDTVYPVIAEPPVVGATQVIVTLVFELFQVDGAAGTLGITAVMTCKEGQ